MPRKSKNRNEVGQESPADKRQRRRADPVPATVDQIIPAVRAWHRERCFAMNQRKRIDLALGSFLRTQLGWRRDLPKVDCDRIAKCAADLVKCGEAIAKGKAHCLSDIDEFKAYENTILAAIQSRDPWDAIEKSAVKELEQLAMQLPAWRSFGEAIRGFGPVSLAVILGEAGDLSLYSTHSKLWKRMGLAVMDGVRQGGLAKGASKEDWIVHGYSAQRRSRMWNIGDALIKGNREGKYRTAYLERKAYEIARDPEIKPIKAHRRAQRYMEKRLLRDLWQAWRACQCLAVGSMTKCPPPIIEERRAA